MKHFVLFAVEDREPACARTLQLFVVGPQGGRMLNDLINGLMVCHQDLRPTAETLLQTPLVEKHETRQEETMRDWLVRLGEPHDPCMGGVDEPMFFAHWNANPLLPPPTPRGEQPDGGEQQGDSPPSSAGAVERDQHKEDAECDLSRVPLQFLLQSNLEACEADVESAHKRQRTNQGFPQ
jgi:hypothetical protein